MRLTLLKIIILSRAGILVIPKSLLNFQLQIRSDRNLSASTNQYSFKIIKKEH